MNTLDPWQPELELAAWKELFSTLIREQVLLRDGNVDPLNDLATRKRGLVTSLAPHVRARGSLLQKNGCANTPDGMNAIISRSGNQQAARLWQEIRETERMARDLNQINGRLINLRLSVVEKSLNVLSSAAGRQKLYNPGGHATYEMRANALAV